MNSIKIAIIPDCIGALVLALVLFLPDFSQAQQMISPNSTESLDSAKSIDYTKQRRAAFGRLSPIRQVQYYQDYGYPQAYPPSYGPFSRQPYAPHSPYVPQPAPYRSSIQYGQTADPPWTQHIIPTQERSFDFKTVARGARTEHRFVLKNKFTEPLHIASITSSCTCTTVSLLDNQNEVQTYGETAVVALFRTDLFEGPKSATITVVIDKPHQATFHLNVRGEIRSDISISPNSVRFDNIKTGTETSRTVTISYAGPNAGWKIMDFKSPNENITGEVVDVQGRLGSITTKVKITVGSEMPKGEFVERLYLVSNDSESRREIPIIVQGVVGTMVRVTPSTVFLGFLKPGQESPTKTAMLRGTRPFKITKITCDNPEVEINFTPNPDAPAKILYPLPIRYTNSENGDGAPKDGRMHAVVTIETDDPDLMPTFNVTMATAKEE